MRKTILPLLAGVALMWGQAAAQTQIGNSDFEQWENVGSNTEEPINWNGIKTSSGGNGGLAPKSIQRSSQFRPGSSGIYSARVYSSSVLGIVANGNITLGQVNAGAAQANSPNNYNISRTANTNFSEPLNAYPDSIVFWAKYNNNNAASLARMSSTIHGVYDYRDPSTSDANAPLYVVATAILNFPKTNSAWVRFSVPFTYSGPWTTPSFILTTFTSNSVPGGGASGDEVFIDDVQLIYVPRTTTVSTISPLTYQVSATQGASISIPFTKTGIFEFANVFTAQLSDASGSFANPITLGTLTSNNAGTITGTIPAGTPSGTGYRVRVIASSPNTTPNINQDNISITLVSNQIAPTANQLIGANTNGTPLNVTETGTATSRTWKFSTTAGGPYTAFNPSETGTTYTPNFASAGTYYVVCESTFGNLPALSNEVEIQVVQSSITPNGTQSLLVNVPGNTLTVTETPAGSAREWLFATTSGGPYQAFSPQQTGNTYLPLFNTAGTYYIICQSTIGGIQVNSNEVIISVGNASLTTGTITGSPFQFSASAPDANVTVPYTVSAPLNAGNVFTAQLSDASGSFANATNIGTVTSNTGGTISAVIPATTPGGTGYLIRVTASDPAILGSDNGTALTVDQFSNNVAPAAPQTFVYTQQGTSVSVSESQNANSREWRIGTTSGGPYSAITPAATGVSYIPSVSAPGTYYLVCASTNQYGDEVISNEVMLNVQNGTTLNTSAIGQNEFFVSPSANVTTPVNFTTNIVFGAGNVFTAELSDATGSFASPTAIGTLSSQTQGTITGTIPNVIFDGSGYRIRVTSSNPAVNGTDNGSNLTISNFAVSLSNTDTSFVAQNVAVPSVSAISSHPGVNVEWKFRTSIVSGYFSFNPPITGSTFNHTFPNANNYQVVAQVVNQWDDTLVTDAKVYSVYSTFGVNDANLTPAVCHWNDGFLFIGLENTQFNQPLAEIINMAGQVIFQTRINGVGTHQLPISPAAGVYTLRLTEGERSFMRKIQMGR
jgi:hypothetical protein